MIKPYFLGEFRRCYDDAGLIRALGWLEICYAVGINIGPGTPVLFSGVQFTIFGGWEINQYNATSFFVAIINVLVFAFSWFYVSDLSKELNVLKKKNDKNEPTAETGRKESKNSTQFVEWRNMLSIEILALSLSYAFSRYAVSTTLLLTSIIAPIDFHWQINTLSWCHVLTGSTSYIVLSVFVKMKCFKGKRKIFFIYIIFITIAMMVLAALILPKAITITHYHAQIAYIVLMLASKCFVYFIIMTLGKFLMFETVDHHSSSFIDGFRTAVGNVVKIYCYLTVFLFHKYPHYFATPVVIILFIHCCYFLVRRNTFI